MVAGGDGQLFLVGGRTLQGVSHHVRFFKGSDKDENLRARFFNSQTPWKLTDPDFCKNRTSGANGHNSC